MAKPNFDTFLDLVERSGLVGKESLDRFLAAHSAIVKARDVDALAEKLVADNVVTRWQADRLLEGRYKGFFLKKYRLLDQLGRGGMSTVYLAEHVLMQRRVAIKVLPKDRVEDTSYLARFHREAEAAGALDHRNIVRAYDVDNDGGLHFIVMEYVEGRDLQQTVKRDGPLDYALAADYIRQAAEGLAHAHQANLIHRDVKPANLLVDQKSVVKILDLGLARFTDEDRASLTVAYDENVLGTADYLAPEQALDSHGVDARADIYGLGCSFYYLLTGHPPFADGTLPQRLMMHQKQQPPSVRIDRPDAPQDLLDIVAKMMEKKPANRYQTATEVAQTIGRWMTLNGHIGANEGSGATVRSPVATSADALRNVPPVRQPLKGTLPPRRTPGDSGGLAHESSSSSSVARRRTIFTDTVASSEQNTVKGNSPVAPGKGATGLSSKKNLPPIRSRDEESGSEFVLDIPSYPRMTPQGQGAGGDPLALAGRSHRKQQAPVWLWAAMGGGCILAIVLLLILRMIM